MNIGNNKKGVHVKSKLISVLNRLSKEDADEEILEPLTTTDVIEGDEQEDSAVEDERDIEAATQHVNDSGEAVDDLITNVEIVESAGTEVTTEMMNDLKISYITACNISGCQLKKSIMSVESFDSFSNEDFRDTVLTIIRNIKEFIKITTNSYGVKPLEIFSLYTNSSKIIYYVNIFLIDIKYAF